MGDVKAINQATRDKALHEKAMATRAAAAWDEFVKPFFDAKKVELFEMFQDIPTSQTDGLMTLKLQLNALNALQGEFVNYLETGKMADKTLQQLKGTEKEKSNEQ